jgi:hypothetical protein
VELIVVDEGKERSMQRNVGIDRATGGFLLFLDSDQEVSSTLIEECVLRDCAVYIPEIIIAKGIFGAIRKWERCFYTGTSVDVVRFVPKGCPRFDETMSGPEDSDWDRRILDKRQISVSPLYHNDNISLLDYLKKKAYYIQSMKRFAEKWPKDKILNFKWRCWGVFMENGKWKLHFKHPFLSLGMFFIIFLRGLIYVSCYRSKP